MSERHEHVLRHKYQSKKKIATEHVKRHLSGSATHKDAIDDQKLRKRVCIVQRNEGSRLGVIHTSHNCFAERSVTRHTYSHPSEYVLSRHQSQTKYRDEMVMRQTEELVLAT